MLFFQKKGCQIENSVLKLLQGRNCGGQVMVEYVVMILFCLLIVLALIVHIYLFSESGWQTITQVGIGYP